MPQRDLASGERVADLSRLQIPHTGGSVLGGGHGGGAVWPDRDTPDAIVMWPKHARWAGTRQVPQQEFTLESAAQRPAGAWVYGNGYNGALVSLQHPLLYAGRHLEDAHRAVG